MYVVKGQGNTALLSCGAAERMGLMEYHLDLISSTSLPAMGETRQEAVDLVEEYKDTFSGLGKPRGSKVKLNVDLETKGAVQKQRTISLPLKDKFDEILDKWKEMDTGADLGGGCRGCAPSPEMKLSSMYLRTRFYFFLPHRQ